MKFTVAILLFLLGHIYRCNAWGFWGHRMINRMACFTLPPELFGFYKDHIDYITVHAVDPDKRRYQDPEEAPRHFIDLDNYGDSALTILPKRWKDACEKIGEDSIKKHGIVPWHVPFVYAQLKKAFMEKDSKRILYLSACLGHYIGDAHVPLHCTKNYNGQLTGQNGIHGFWESRLPELFGDEYDYCVGQAFYIDNTIDKIWSVIRDSQSALDSVLRFEKQLSELVGADQKFTYEIRGSQTVRVFTKEYSELYHKMLDGQVERRIQNAVVSVGSYWYSAWVDAGMPDLQPLVGDPEDEPEKDKERKFAVDPHATNCE